MFKFKLIYRVSNVPISNGYSSVCYENVEVIVYAENLIKAKEKAMSAIYGDKVTYTLVKFGIEEVLPAAPESQAGDGKEEN